MNRSQSPAACNATIQALNQALNAAKKAKLPGFSALLRPGRSLALSLHFSGVGDLRPRGKQTMAMARFSVMYIGHFILFSAFLLFYMALLIGLIARMVRRYRSA